MQTVPDFPIFKFSEQFMVVMILRTYILGSLPVCFPECMMTMDLERVPCSFCVIRKYATT